MAAKLRVLFLCTGNSCRSQMAEGFLRHLTGDCFEVASAGSNPVALNPDAVRVMKEAGVDISGHRSKNVSEFLGQRFTYVITVCDSARQACSVFPGASRTLHWNLDDPAAARGTQEEHLSVFRRVRDEIETHIRGFIAPASQQLH